MEPEQNSNLDSDQINPNIIPEQPPVHVIPVQDAISNTQDIAAAQESFREPKNGLLPYLLISGVIIIAGIAISLVTIFGGNKNEDIEGAIGSSSESSRSNAIVGNWGCFPLSAFGQIYHENGTVFDLNDNVGEMKKDNTFKITMTNDNTSSDLVGKWEEDGFVKGEQTSNWAFDIVRDGNKAVFDRKDHVDVTYDKYVLSLYPNNRDVKTKDGKPYQVKLWVYFDQNDKKKEQAMVAVSDSNNENYFSSALAFYCMRNN